jgi:hypothetical protein
VTEIENWLLLLLLRLRSGWLVEIDVLLLQLWYWGQLVW